MEGFPKQEDKHFLTEEEVLATQTEEDLKNRLERHQRVIHQLNEAIPSLKSRIASSRLLTLDELKGYGKIYNEAVGVNDLDSKYPDSIDNVSIVREKMDLLWEMLSSSFEVAVESAKQRNDIEALQDLAQAYFRYHKIDEPKYHEYLRQDFKDWIDSNAEKIDKPKRQW